VKASDSNKSNVVPLVTPKSTLPGEVLNVEAGANPNAKFESNNGPRGDEPPTGVGVEENSGNKPLGSRKEREARYDQQAWNPSSDFLPEDRHLGPRVDAPHVQSDSGKGGFKSRTKTSVDESPYSVKTK
jgi:hypothetical protein